MIRLALDSKLIWACEKSGYLLILTAGTAEFSLRYKNFPLAFLPRDPYPLRSPTPSTGQTSDSMDNKGITGSFNVNSFNKIVHTTITDDKNQILQWLSPLEPQRRHQHLRESRLEGVGEWIFQTSEFRRWNTREDGSSGSMLFCHGDPGVGKTHLR